MLVRKKTLLLAVKMETNFICRCHNVITIGNGVKTTKTIQNIQPLQLWNRCFVSSLPQMFYNLQKSEFPVHTLSTSTVEVADHSCGAAWHLYTVRSSYPSSHSLLCSSPRVYPFLLVSPMYLPLQLLQPISYTIPVYRHRPLLYSSLHIMQFLLSSQ